MTLSANDWVTSSGIAGGVFDRWPGYQAILVAADHVDLERLAPIADQLVEEARAFARELDGAELDPHVVRWQQAYRDFGVKPRVARASVDALLRRAVSDRGLPRINTLVDVYNAISMIHRVPIGGEDLDHYDGPARLVLASGNEPFHTTANGEQVMEHPDRGEPVWIDDIGVTCRRWNWRQTTRTAIQTSTVRVGFIIDSLDAPDHPGALDAAAHLGDLMAGAATRTISAQSAQSAPPSDEDTAC